MPIDNPAALVEEFKKSGEFDRLRRELLAQFRQVVLESYAALKARVEEIARQRLETDSRLQYQPTDVAIKELIQEVERYPIVERAVSDGRIFSDSAFLTNMQSAIQRILQEDRKKKASSLSASTGDNFHQEKGSIVELKSKEVHASENGQKNKESGMLSLDDVGLVNDSSPSTTTTKYNNEISGKSSIAQPENSQKSSETITGDPTVPGSMLLGATSPIMDVDLPRE